MHLGLRWRDMTQQCLDESCAKLIKAADKNGATLKLHKNNHGENHVHHHINNILEWPSPNTKNMVKPISWSFIFRFTKKIFLFGMGYIYTVKFILACTECEKYACQFLTCSASLLQKNRIDMPRNACNKY